MWTFLGAVILPTTVTQALFSFSDLPFLYLKNGDNHMSFELNTQEILNI